MPSKGIFRAILHLICKKLVWLNLLCYVHIFLFSATKIAARRLQLKDDVSKFKITHTWIIMDHYLKIYLDLVDLHLIHSCVSGRILINNEYRNSCSGTSL